MRRPQDDPCPRRSANFPKEKLLGGFLHQLPERLLSSVYRGPPKVSEHP